MSGVHVSQHNIHMTARTRLREKKNKMPFFLVEKDIKMLSSTSGSEPGQ